jgi:hypothetical protein
MKTISPSKLSLKVQVSAGWEWTSNGQNCVNYLYWNVVRMCVMGGRGGGTHLRCGGNEGGVGEGIINYVSFASLYVSKTRKERTFHGEFTSFYTIFRKNDSFRAKSGKSRFISEGEGGGAE